MTVKYSSKITAVGAMAQEFLDKNSSFILMDEGKHPNLADTVVQHTVSELKEEIVEGDKIQVGRTEMKILKVGGDVNKNLREIGHCTVVVNGEGTLPGQLVVKSDIPPRLRIGNEVTIFSK